MRRFRLYHPLWMAFYSKVLYRDVGQNWGGRGLGYLSILLLIAFTPQGITFCVSAVRWADAHARLIERELPNISIRSGQVSVEPPGRHVIADPDTGEPLIVIDLDFPLADLDQMDSAFLLTRTHLVLRRAPHEMRILDLRSWADRSFTPQQVASWVRFVTWLALVFLVPAIYLAALIYRHVQVLIYGAIGLLLSNLARIKLSYQTLVRLSTVAITPPVLLSAVHAFLPVRVPFLPLICFVMAMAYLHFAIRANAPDPQQRDAVRS